MSIHLTLPRRISKAKPMGNPFFAVKDVPILRGDTMAPTGDRYLVNGDTDRIMGTVSKGYKITTYEETAKVTQDFLASMNLPFEIQFTKIANGGKKFVQALAFPQFETNLASVAPSTALDSKGWMEDKIIPRLLSKNSYDKTNLNSFEFGLFRGICSNGKVLPYKDATTKISFRHNSIVDAPLVQDTILSGLEKATSFIQLAYSNLNQENGLVYINKLLNAPALSNTFKKAILDKLAGHIELDLDVKVTPGERGEVTEWDIKKIETQETAWAVYNVATEVSTHVLTSYSEQTKTDKMIAHLFLDAIEA